MEKKQMWLRLVQEKSAHYLNLGDGGFDERMRARLVDCDYEGQTVTYAFPTQDWQINEKGGIHGGAIAGMFDAAFGVVANFTAGENEATTVDMSVSFLRGVEYGTPPFPARNRSPADPFRCRPCRSCQTCPAKSARRRFPPAQSPP